jgi:hypothetical protein
MKICKEGVSEKIVGDKRYYILSLGYFPAKSVRKEIKLSPIVKNPSLLILADYIEYRSNETNLEKTFYSLMRGIELIKNFFKPTRIVSKIIKFKKNWRNYED